MHRYPSLSPALLGKGLFRDDKREKADIKGISRRFAKGPSRGSAH
jgi:hypothetical protein